MKQRRAKPTLETLVKKIDHANATLTERLISMTSTMQSHIEADARAFQELGTQIIEVNKDVKSLLASRSFLRGTWFAVGVFGTLVVSITGLVAAFWPHISMWFK